MAKSKYKVSEFDYSGQIEKIITKSPGVVKYIKLATESGRYKIKLAKELRSNLDARLTKGCRVRVTGDKKEKRKSGEIKLKAQTFEVIRSQQEQKNNKVVPIAPQPQIKSKAKISICQKGSCWKKGGKEVCKVFEETVSDRGLADYVQVRTVGCMGKCDKGPNLAIVSAKGGRKYSKVKPKEVCELVDLHFA